MCTLTLLWVIWVYSESNGEPLEGSEQGSDMIRFMIWKRNTFTVVLRGKKMKKGRKAVLETACLPQKAQGRGLGECFQNPAHRRWWLRSGLITARVVGTFGREVGTWFHFLSKGWPRLLRVDCGCKGGHRDSWRLPQWSRERGEWCDQSGSSGEHSPHGYPKLFPVCHCCKQFVLQFFIYVFSIIFFFWIIISFP